ncbi:MAG: PDZ domain-containing protein [Planctomycetota bacterium]|nr:MAG: PDZ domain-containing protein [Planctomycetota bacterium]
MTTTPGNSVLLLRWWVLPVALLALTSQQTSSPAATPEETIAGASRRVVKLYGAGGVRGLEAYQTGVLVSPAGHIVTVLSTVLDSDAIDCVLDDGRRYPATLLGADPRRELAVLSIAGDDLPAFTLPEPVAEGLQVARVPSGTRVFALSNLFGVAVGDERVSAQHGVIATTVPLEARRGAHEAPYKGDVYILDCTTSNPGSAGGALVDWRGRLVGMLGKELRATATGVWLNYALPIDEVARGYRDVLAAQGGAPAGAADLPGETSLPFDTARLGAILVPDLLDKTPPFVESVREGSAAASAGLRPDDLLVAVNGRAVASRGAVQQVLGLLAEGDPLRFTVIREGGIVECSLGPKPAAARKP